MFPEFNRLFIQKALEDIIGELDLFSKAREQSDEFLKKEEPRIAEGLEGRGDYAEFKSDPARAERARAPWRGLEQDRAEQDEALESWFDPRNKEMTQEALDILHKAKADFEEEAKFEEEFENDPITKLYRHGRKTGQISDDYAQGLISQPSAEEEEEALERYITDDVSDDDWWEMDVDDSPQSEKGKWELVSKILEEYPERDPNKPIPLGQDDDINGEMKKIAKQLAKEDGQEWLVKAVTSGRIPATIALALITSLWSKPAY